MGSKAPGVVGKSGETVKPPTTMLPVDVKLTASPSGLPMQAYDCRFIGNNGVALASQNASIVIGNSTLVANDISDFPPFGWPILTASQNASITLNNSIVRDHNINGTGQFADKWVAFLGSLTLNESCVEGWDGSLPGTGNFDADPLFVDALGLDGLRGTEDDAVRLQASSPCLDRANPSLRPSSLGSGSALGLTSAQALLVDLDGTDRHVDQPLSADFPGACPPAGDLGAYDRGAFGPWTNFTPGPGTFNPLFGACQPHLAANGALTPGSLTTFDASSAPPSSPGWIVFGLTQANLLVEGQLLVPNLNQYLPMNSDPLGHAHKQLPFPTTLPSGLTIYAQTWFFDLTTFQWKATNAQVGQTP